MIKFERVEVMNWENAIRGARNPMNSWEKSDSKYGCQHGFCDMGIDCPEWYECYGSGREFIIGPNDLALLMRLRNAGTDHRKFMRQIMVSVDITAPLYWWKEFDTYKVGTVANSCSTMHKLTAKEFEESDFSFEFLRKCSRPRVIEEKLEEANELRDAYLKFDTDENLRRNCEREGVTKKDIWYALIQLLPSSYNQLRTVTLNYEVLANMYAARKDHKLDEWLELCSWVTTLPYSQLITGGDGNE